jgi:hypothetical protein
MQTPLDLTTLDNDIRAAHSWMPISDLEKTLKEAETLADQQSTIPEGFEAGDPQNWLEGETIQPFESTLLPPKRWLEEDFIPFNEDSGSSSSSNDSIEIFGC